MHNYLSLLFLIFLFIPLFALNLYSFGETHHIYLANSFLQGSLSLVQLPQTLTDFAYFNGHYYWPQGLFPAVLLAPFVWIFSLNFQESFLKFPLTVINFWFVYKIALSLKLQKIKAIFISIFFIFGSVYTPVAAIPLSVYFSQVVTVTILLWAIYEFLNSKRYFLIGTLIALAFLTRATTIFASAFFLIPLLKKPLSAVNGLKFIIPITTALLLFGYYNYSRFGNILETGYHYQADGENPAGKDFTNRKLIGLFSPKHIPTNLYYMLLKTPDPATNADSHSLQFPFAKTDYYGLSIFFTSPILFLLFRTNLKEQLSKIAMITCLLIALPIITYAGIGYFQIGYRYALDFLPFLLIPLAPAVKKVKLRNIQILIALGVFITWFFIIQTLVDPT